MTGTCRFFVRSPGFMNSLAKAHACLLAQTHTDVFYVQVRVNR